MLARRSVMQIHADACVSIRKKPSALRSDRTCPKSFLLLVIVLVSCECQAIRVPIVWEDTYNANSEVKDQVETFPVTLQQNPKQQTLSEYFEYTAHKPQFAVDIAEFHGVKNPQNHYKAYPVRPFTSKHKPELGKHHMLDEDKEIYKPFQQYVNRNEERQSHINPIASSYEVFHPYKAEEPALQELYKDPILDKIRNDLKDSKAMTQKYEKDAEKPDIEDGEYLESPEQTDRKKFPHKNVPTTYEIHRPLRRPVYYRPPPQAFTHEDILNHKFRHPWNQNFVMVRPRHYRPLKNHIQNLRQHHALKYDDDHNEYPQVPPLENFAEPPDGYDIYLKGQDKYNQLRNNLDENINTVALHNRPPTYQRLELENKDTNEDSDENDFVPIKSYAQVRKTESTKHLPKSAALADAASYDDLINAHRLREAVKSTRAQTVYSEEGYEDAAYDHAGEQKHASDHEGHGGFLKESEISGGKYKTPSFSGKYQDSSGSIYRDKKHHGKKWQNDNKDNEDQNDSEDYDEDEHELSIEEDKYGNVPDDIRHKREHDSNTDQDNESSNNTPSHEAEGPEEGEGTDESEEKEVSEEPSEDDQEENRHKRENIHIISKAKNVTKNLKNVSKSKPHNNENRGPIPSIAVNVTENRETDHDVIKREASFEIPEFDFNSTILSEEEINKLAKHKLPKPKNNKLREKYPYYFKKSKSLHKDSPLRYSENLKLIPLKSKGGTEFYDSRSNIKCSEVDDEVDPIPEKIKNNGTRNSEEKEEDDESNKDEKEKFDNLKNKERLKGLGDKIDCFKAKYFGKNPLDSPFFKEEVIASPEPIKTPKLKTFKLITFGTLSSNLKDDDSLQEATGAFDLRNKLKNSSLVLQDSLARSTEKLKSSFFLPYDYTLSNDSQQTKVQKDILENIRAHFQTPFAKQKIVKIYDHVLNLSGGEIKAENVTYEPLKNKEHVINPPLASRRKRAAPFIYEPYKIIREGQSPESRKTTTTGNISPLIRQLQSSKVVEKVSNFNQGKDQPVKRNVHTRTYKDISRKDREKYAKIDEPGFIDVNIDQRRGEPRYEIKPANHKTHYSPVDHKKAMSVEDYENQTNTTISPKRYKNARVVKSLRSPSSLESAASKKVNRIASTTSAPKKTPEPRKPIESEESEEEYGEYDEDEEVLTTTTTTTVKPSFRKRYRPTSTTPNPMEDDEDDEEDVGELPKLRLITRFNKPHATDKPILKEELNKHKPTEIVKEEDDHAPKYREKKKKTRKSTLVTDTQRYGDDDDDDMMKEEVDAMIGGKQKMNDYIPTYEKETDEMLGDIKKKNPESSEEEDEEDEGEDEYDEDDEKDEDDGETEDEDYESSSDEDESQREEQPEPAHIILTTPEPTKRTLLRTTESPISTTEGRSAKLEAKPVIHKKKIEIHKELPVNMSSPHVTQFRQDIKEVEIIKESPQKRKKQQKNVEVLELFKNEKLAEEINKLKDVEIFRENLDLKEGPRHGGNYRAAEIREGSVTTTTHKPARRRVSTNRGTTQKPESEESNPKRDIEVKSRHGAHKKMYKDGRPKDNEPANAKNIELSDLSQSRSLHGGNLKSLQDNYKPRGNSRNAKLVELDDEYDNDDDADDMHGGNFKSYDNSASNGGLHGGNYRSAKLVQGETHGSDSEKNNKETLQSRSRSAKVGRHNPAAILDGFAKAVPILTTTPNYIKDPSKRMYYYVDT